VLIHVAIFITFTIHILTVCNENHVWDLKIYRNEYKKEMYVTVLPNNVKSSK